MMSNSLLIKLISLLSLITVEHKGVASIKDVQLYFPSVVSIGEPVRIGCGFNLENEYLYSIKLYRGNKEFLHFIPEFTPPYSVYPVKGIQVKSTNISLATMNLHYEDEGHKDIQSIAELKHIQVGAGDIQLALKDVNLYTQGLYACEISADSPSWDTRIVTRRLHVLVEPKSQPAIIGVESLYKPGQNLQLTCISQMTHPASNITWYMDGVKVEAAGTEHTTEHNGLLTTRSFLNATINHSVQVKCLASLWTHHYQSKDYTLLVKDPPMASVISNQTNYSSYSDVSPRPDVAVLWNCLMILYLCAPL